MKRITALLLSLAILLCFAAVPAYAETVDAETDTDAQTALHIIGDADGDQVVTIIDATWIQRALLGVRLPFDFNKDTADADEDGEVTIIDVTGIQRWLNNTSIQLNVGQEVIPWFDKSEAYRADYIDAAQRLLIIRICRTCFYAYSEEYNYIYKINGVDGRSGLLFGQFGVGDEIGCTFDNIYYPESNLEDFPLRAEADLLSVSYPWTVPDPYVCYKPVIYLYPEEETEVGVKLDLNGSFLYTKPAYEDGWTVTAAPDGTLTAEDGRIYPYLFWEGKLNTEYDFSTGFCIEGSDTEAFLKESLAEMGLNDTETEDFIGFWLPLMKKNPYNVISFQTEAYTDAAQLSISPQPDTTIRVFMAWYSSDEVVDIPAQTLPKAQRSGFTAVEWGGTYVPFSVSD